MVRRKLLLAFSYKICGLGHPSGNPSCLYVCHFSLIDMDSLCSRTEPVLHQSRGEFGPIRAPLFSSESSRRCDLLTRRFIQTLSFTCFYARLLPWNSPQLEILHLTNLRVLTATISLSTINSRVFCVQRYRPPSVCKNASCDGVLMSEWFEVCTVPHPLLIGADLLHSDGLLLDTLYLVHKTLRLLGVILQLFKYLASVPILFIYFVKSSHESLLSKIWTHENVIRAFLNLLLLARFLKDRCGGLMENRLGLLRRCDFSFLCSYSIAMFRYVALWIWRIHSRFVDSSACNIVPYSLDGGLLLPHLQFLKELWTFSCRVRLWSLSTLTQLAMPVVDIERA